MREGSEPDVFWKALGGKAEYSREKEIKGYLEDPRLFTCSFTDGKLNTLSLNFFVSKDNVHLSWFRNMPAVNGCKNISNGGLCFFCYWSAFALR